MMNASQRLDLPSPSLQKYLLSTLCAVQPNLPLQIMMRHLQALHAMKAPKTASPQSLTRCCVPVRHAGIERINAATREHQVSKIGTAAWAPKSAQSPNLARVLLLKPCIAAPCVAA